MFARSAVAAVSDRRRRSEIDATNYVALFIVRCRISDWVDSKLIRTMTDPFPARKWIPPGTLVLHSMFGINSKERVYLSLVVEVSMEHGKRRDLVFQD